MRTINPAKLVLAATATALAAAMTWAGVEKVRPMLAKAKGSILPGAGSSFRHPLSVPSNDGPFQRIPKVAERIKRMWGEATGETDPISPASLELLLAQIWGESGVAEPGGGGWWEDASDPNGTWAKRRPDAPLQGDMRGSGNLGGLQCKSCNDSASHYTCVAYGDTHPMPDGSSKFYPVCFKYFRDADGRSAGDWAALEYLKTVKRLLKDLAPLKGGNLQQYAQALRKGGYYEGFGKTQEERIEHYEQMMLCHLPAVAAALGHSRVEADIRTEILDKKNPACANQKYTYAGVYDSLDRPPYKSYDIGKDIQEQDRRGCYHCGSTKGYDRTRRNCIDCGKEWFGKDAAAIGGAGAVVAAAAGVAATAGAIAWGASKAAEAKDARASLAAESIARNEERKAMRAALEKQAPAPAPQRDPIKDISATAMSLANLVKGLSSDGKAGPRPQYSERQSYEEHPVSDGEPVNSRRSEGRQVSGEVGSAAGTAAVVAASAATAGAALYAAKSIADAAAKAPGALADTLNPFATTEAKKVPSASHGPHGEPKKGAELDPYVEPEQSTFGKLIDSAYDNSPLAAIRRSLNGADMLQALHLAGTLPRARVSPTTGEFTWYIEVPESRAAGLGGHPWEVGPIGPPGKVPVPAEGGGIVYVSEDEAAAAGATRYEDGSWNVTTARPIGSSLTTAVAAAGIAASLATVAQAVTEAYSAKHAVRQIKHELEKDGVIPDTKTAPKKQAPVKSVAGDDSSDGPGEPIRLPPVEVGTLTDPDDMLMRRYGLTPEQALAQGWTQVVFPGCSDCSKPGWIPPKDKSELGSIYDADAHARQAKSDLAQLLGNPVWLRGIGIGEKDGNPAILVNVRTHDDARRSEIPSSVRMVPVMVRAVGDIAAHMIGAPQDDIFSAIDAAATVFSDAWMPGSGKAISALVRTGKGAIDTATGHDPGRAHIAPSLAEQAQRQEAEASGALAAQLERQAKANDALAAQKAAEEAKMLACAPKRSAVRRWVANHRILASLLSPSLKDAAGGSCSNVDDAVEAFVETNPVTVKFTSPDLRAYTGKHAELAKAPLVKVKRNKEGRMKRADVGSASEPQASGLMLRAIREGRQAPVRWATIMLDDDIEVEVMGDAMKAEVDGQLLRLPVSYAETIAAAEILGKGTLIPFSKRIADAVYRQSAKLVYNGLVSGRQSRQWSSAADSNRMRSLDFVRRFNADIDAQIERKDAAGSLIFGPWKLWILSSKLGVMAKDSPTEPAAINYGGWNAAGRTIQTEGTHHTYGHDDYSQLLQFAKRWATRKGSGGRVDLLAWIERDEGVGSQYTEPFRG